MKRLEASVARQEFSDTLNHVAYGNRRIVVRRHGKDIAAIVPIRDLETLEDCEDEDGVVPAGRRGSTGRKKVARDRRPRSSRRAPTPGAKK